MVIKTGQNIKSLKNPKDQNEFIDHILEFDPEDISTAAAFSSLQPEFMAPKNLPPIPFPQGLNPLPLPEANPKREAPLPECDYLIVTWTVAEALALSDILTPGSRSKTDWYDYAHLFDVDYKPIIKKGAPSLASNRLGIWFMTSIGGKTVLCFKSDLHLARDGANLPVKNLWKQLIGEVKPKTVITTGTAGAIGKNILLGDVVVSKKVRFKCEKTFKNSLFNNQEYKSAGSVRTKNFKFTNDNLLPINAQRLPAAARPPRIVYKTSTSVKEIDVVTTDFFAYDNSIDTYGLQSLGSAVEMGDAVLGLVCDEMGVSAPEWYAVRNASDPQIDGNLSPKDQIQLAARIYEKYGYWTTVESALACWALIA